METLEEALKRLVETDSDAAVRWQHVQQQYDMLGGGDWSDVNDRWDGVDARSYLEAAEWIVEGRQNDEQTPKTKREQQWLAKANEVKRIGIRNIKKNTPLWRWLLRQRAEYRRMAAAEAMK